MLNQIAQELPDRSQSLKQIKHQANRGLGLLIRVKRDQLFASKAEIEHGLFGAAARSLLVGRSTWCNHRIHRVGSLALENPRTNIYQTEAVVASPIRPSLSVPKPSGSNVKKGSTHKPSAAMIPQNHPLDSLKTLKNLMTIGDKIISRRHVSAMSLVDALVCEITQGLESHVFATRWNHPRTLNMGRGTRAGETRSRICRIE